MNRLEFACVSSKKGVFSAERNLVFDDPLYIRVGNLISAVPLRRIEAEGPLPRNLFIRWDGWNPHTRDVVTEIPEEPEGFEQYIDYRYVSDRGWRRSAVYYYERHGMKDTQAGTMLAFTHYDPLTGNCWLKHSPGTRMVYSRGDGVRDAKEMMGGSGLGNYQSALANWRHNPTHEMAEAVRVTAQKI